MWSLWNWVYATTNEKTTTTQQPPLVQGRINHATWTTVARPVKGKGTQFEVDTSCLPPEALWVTDLYLPPQCDEFYVYCSRGMYAGLSEKSHFGLSNPSAVRQTAAWWMVQDWNDRKQEHLIVKQGVPEDEVKVCRGVIKGETLIIDLDVHRLGSINADGSLPNVTLTYAFLC